MNVASLVPGCIAVALLIGCDDRQSGETTATQGHLAAERQVLPADSAEASWATQIAAVREGRSHVIRLSESAIDDVQLQQLSDGCGELTTLVIDVGSVGPGDLAVLSQLPKLRWIKLPGRVDDAGLAAISQCRELEMLNVPEGIFSDQGCAAIARLDQLMLLRFGSDHVTDRGIAALSRLPRLRFLHLLDVPITDAGLDHVASMSTLESFYLDGGEASDAGLSRLIVERPDLHVHLDQTHIPGDPNAHD